MNAWRPAMRMRWCLLWSKYLLSHKNQFFSRSSSNRGLVLTTTSDRSLISNNGSVKDWFQRSSRCSTQKFNENAHFLKSGKSFLLLSTVLDDTNQQIFLKVLLVETSSIRTFNKNIQHFANKVRSYWEFFRNWVLKFCFWHLQSTVALKSKILTSTSASSFDTHFGLRFVLSASTLALVLDDSLGLQFNFGGILDFKIQSLRLLRSSPLGSDACFGLPCTLRRAPSASAEWRRHSWRAPALAACWRLYLARTGNLQQQHC